MQCLLVERLDPLVRSTQAMAAQLQQQATGGEPASSDEESEEEEGQAPPQPAPTQAAPPKQVGQDVSVAKFMPKPAPFSGAEDVDEALFSIETYLEATGIDVVHWPKLVVPLLTGDARHAWMTVAAPFKLHGKQPTWEQFCLHMRRSFASPDKDFHARMQLRHVRQQSLTSVQYVRKVNALIASLVHEPPSPKEQLIALFDGLNPAVKNAAMVDPRTGKFWDSYDALANQIITLETHANTRIPSHPPATVQVKRSFSPPCKRVAMVQGKKEKGGYKQQQGGQR